MNPRQWRAQDSDEVTRLRRAAARALALLVEIRENHKRELLAKRWPYAGGGPLSETIDDLRAALGFAAVADDAVEIEATVLPKRIRQDHP